MSVSNPIDRILGPAGGKVQINADGSVSVGNLADGLVSIVGGKLTASGSGTTNTLPLWTGSTALGNSLLSQSGGNVVQASGQLLLPNGTAALPSLALSADPSTGISSDGASRLWLGVGGVRSVLVASDALYVQQTGGISIGGVIVLRDAANNTLGLRNGTAAQSFNIYNTYTDASNYERGFARWASNEFLLGAEKAGTGTLRNVVVPNTLIVRQPGGTAGTNEVQVSHNGTLGNVKSMGGDLILDSASGFIRLNYFGTINASYSGGSGWILNDTGGGYSLLLNNQTIPTVAAAFNSAAAQLGATFHIKWVSANTYFSGSLDTGIKRTAAGVVATTDGISGAGWLQNTAGRARVTADVTESAGTLTNLTDLTITVKAGRKYIGQYTIFAKNSTGADGLQFDLAGTATFTDLQFGFAAQPTGATLGTVTSTAAGTPITLTVVSTADATYEISFGFTANAAGTVILRGAELTHTTGTATFRKNSFVLIEDCP